MRRLLLIPATVLTLLTLAACGKDGTGGTGDPGAPGEPDEVTIQGVRWNVDSVTVDGTTIPAPDGANVFLKKDDRLEGNYGCNNFGADVELKGDVLVMKGFESTAMGCAADVSRFEAAMQSTLADRVSIEMSADRKTATLTQGDSGGKKGGTLMLSRDTGASKILPFTGTTWTVNSLVTGETAASMPAGAEGAAELVFTKDGTVRGKLGCNTFTAPVKRSGATVNIGPLASTKMLCEGDRNKVEQHLLKVLTGQVSYEVRSHGLTLRGPAGTGLTATAP
ncbi:META domain-containing protein [Streptomyces sp. NPDC017979]|uniref:META domain-containing protein n=1 Tax=Streptomyces sp. NPDC017979 TaxID=3365024 RepID=UPI0037B10A81